MRIKIWNYGGYSSNNYGSCRAVTIGLLTLYFSYKTVIAVEDNGHFIIRENSWGPTTGKHLNWINESKDLRISSGQFETELEQILKKYNLD